MKFTVSYEIQVTKEIEITPQQYCSLRANHHSIKGIFPKNAFHIHFPNYEELNTKNQRELNSFLFREREK